MEVWDSLLRMVSALAVVLGLMLLCAFLFKRLQGTKIFAPAAAPMVKVLGSGYLGSRKSIVLVDVAGELLIVGATATDLVPLGRITNPDHVQRLLKADGPLPSLEPQRP
jgi:flagellar protein FliO/FliZ